MRPRRKLALLALVAIGPIVACTLNPQPLPPGETADASVPSSGNGSAADSGAMAPPPSTDASVSLDGATSGDKDGGGQLGDGDATPAPPDGAATDGAVTDGATDGATDATGDGSQHAGDGGDAGDASADAARDGDAGD